jgi:hypothetical protein
MTSSSRPSSPGQFLPWIALALFAVFALLAGYQKYYADRLRFLSEVDLLAELTDAEFVEETDVSSGWPQWRGQRRDGVVHASRLLTSWPARGPMVLWKKDGGEGFSSFAIGGGRAFSLVRQDNQEVVICWDAENGKVIWKRPYACPFNDQYAGPRSTPTLDEGRLYTVGASGKMYCLEAATGDILWEHDLLSEYQAKNLRWGVAFSPLIEGDLVLTNPGGQHGASIVAFNKLTGKEVWKSLDEIAGYSSPVAATIAGVRQIIFFLGDSLVGVSPTDGSLLWRYEWDTPFKVNAATPIVFQTR